MSSLAASADGYAPGRSVGGQWQLVLGLVLSVGLAARAGAQPVFDQDQIDLTGRQNLTLGSGARAYGMGGAFLARPDDATAASWNPAGLSYLRLPEVSLVGNYNSYRIERGVQSDLFTGGAFDFAALTWPVAVRDLRGAVQLSYQRAIGFDGTREIDFSQGFRADGSSDGGFDVLAFGTGFRLSRELRVGLTFNRWLNGYDQVLTRQLPENARPLREFTLAFQPHGWNANFGIILSPSESLNIGGVFKTSFTADVELRRRRVDYWAGESGIDDVTSNAYTSDEVRLEFPSSFGLGVSWRPRDTLTLSADLTRTSWSQAYILNYFELLVTQRGEPPPPPLVSDRLPYPTLGQLRLPGLPPLSITQVEAEQIRAGFEYVFITSRLKIPLRAGYFNDRQITPSPDGTVPRFNGITVGTGIILGSLLLDVAYLYEFGEYTVTAAVPSAGLDEPIETVDIPSALRTRRFFASLIYRFGGP